MTPTRIIGRAAATATALVIASGALAGAANAETRSATGAAGVGARVAEAGMLWPCKVKTRWRSKVFSKKTTRSSSYWVKKGTVFHGYCWAGGPVSKWTPVRRGFNGKDRYVWHTNLKMI
ncbi:hypothetical protein [Nonomuraea sp. NPDC050643]|uniref:hypothetical protein n=1 Tax=Nonomuraea sp. NPDC050643 TaxID=3155660 RepID=UPI003402B71A